MIYYPMLTTVMVAFDEEKIINKLKKIKKTKTINTRNIAFILHCK